MTKKGKECSQCQAVTKKGTRCKNSIQRIRSSQIKKGTGNDHNHSKEEDQKGCRTAYELRQTF